MVDHVGTGVSFLLYSMPQYAIALLLIQFLSISFHVFPAEAPQATSALGHARRTRPGWSCPWPA